MKLSYFSLVKSSSSGFSALGLMGAVSVGSLLSLGYINLSHYLIAQSALEQATRAAVRCVSPTNGECSSLIQPAAQARWRYFSSTLSPQGDVYGDEYDYSARMFRQQYIAETSYYSISQETAPKVRMTTYMVPTARYREIQPQKRVDLVFQYEGQEQYQVATPRVDAFPKFDQQFERDHMNRSFRQAVGDAQGNQKEIFSRFQPVYSSRFSQRISGSEVERINGDLIRRVNFSSTSEIDLSRFLGGEVPTEQCETGFTCSARAEAGASGNPRTNDYQDTRFLALYLEVELDSHTANASLGIKGRGDSSGLMIDISGSGNKNRFCLGGRDLTKLNALDGRYFNLWLRGPAGAQGSDVDTGFKDTTCDGSYRHSNLQIDKNGSFRPQISLAIGGQRGDQVSGTVTLYAVVDTYGNSPAYRSVNKVCQPVTLKKGATVGQLAPSAEQCGLTGKELNLSRKVISVSESKYDCKEDLNDPGLIAASVTLPQTISEIFSVDDLEPRPREILFAQCSGESPPSEQSVCGWRAVDGTQQKMEVGNLPPGSCLRAEEKKELGDCVDSTTVASCNVDGLRPEACVGTVSKQAQLEQAQLKQAESYEFGELKGLPVGSNNQFLSEIVRGESISPKYNCQNEKSTDGRLDCGVVRAKTLVSLPQLRRVEKGWRPTDLTSFSITGEEPVCGEITRTQVSISATQPEVIEVTGDPFDGEKSLEVALNKPRLEGDLLKCDDQSKEPLTLEQTLREYAALNGFAEAKDSTIEFEYTAKALGSTKLVSSTLGCTTREIATIEGCPQLKSWSAGAQACGAEIDLGQANTEPQRCQMPGVVCRRVFDEVVQAAPIASSAEESVQRAKEIAKNVLQKYLPQSSPGCSSNNCTEVSVELNSDKTVSASSRYEMPLTWPLDQLLGRESIPLSKVRTERVEAL